MSKTKVSNNDYLFLSAMIRAREARMASPDTLRRMLDAADFAECARIASECGWPDVSAEDINGVNAALSGRLADVIGELAKEVPDKAIADIFRAKYDYHNAKVLVKAGAVSVDGQRLMSPAGRVGIQQFIDAFNGEDYSELPPRLGEAIQQARGILSRSSNPQLSDICLDKAYFAELTELAEGGGEFMAEYVRLLIDTANLKTFVRTKRMNKSARFLGEVLIPGGGVSVSKVSAAAENDEAPSSVFGFDVLAKASRLGDGLLQGGALTAFELECDNAVTEFLKKAKMTGFGPEPVAAYLAALEQESTSLRMILTGKLSGIPADTIRERLRDTYA